MRRAPPDTAACVPPEFVRRRAGPAGLTCAVAVPARSSAWSTARPSGCWATSSTWPSTPSIIELLMANPVASMLAFSVHSPTPPQTPQWSTTRGRSQHTPAASIAPAQHCPSASVAIASPLHRPQASRIPVSQHSPLKSSVGGRALPASCWQQPPVKLTIPDGQHPPSASSTPTEHTSLGISHVGPTQPGWHRQRADASSQLPCSPQPRCPHGFEHSPRQGRSKRGLVPSSHVWLGRKLVPSWERHDAARLWMPMPQSSSAMHSPQVPATQRPPAPTVASPQVDATHAATDGGFEAASEQRDSFDSRDVNRSVASDATCPSATRTHPT
mmetsp:Transcript_2151/g.8315  ORF Transcript_2151/g.8315 Transcript_2151/m.8315 type:complete len:328 (+) Transcript_2151:879-1862(+)